MPTDNDATSTWRKIVLRCENAEELSEALFDFGVSGVQVLSGTELVCYLPGDLQPELLKHLADTEFELLDNSSIEDRNWVQECPEMWEELEIGDLQIIPLRAAHARDSAKSDAIQIVIGSGFGSGHHPSTALALELLQFTALRTSQVGLALDMGCGSAVLALAIVKLWGCNVDAIDNDPLALANARQNLAANPGLGDRVHLTAGSFERAAGVYDLIVANIYAEVLCQFSGDFHKHLQTGGYLVLSGIMTNLATAVREAFGATCWRFVNSAEKKGWTAMIFQRRAG